MLLPHEADYDIYDSKPGKDYVTGYVVQVFIPFKEREIAALGTLLVNPKVNAYACIITPYNTIDGSACIAYLFAKTKFEYELLKQTIKGRQMNKAQARLKDTLPTRERVWFHKAWISEHYDPTLFNTDAKKYMRVRHYNEIRNVFGKDKVYEWRKAYYKEKKTCYEPRSEEDEICKNSWTGTNCLCMKCPLSHVADRYDSGGRCLKKVKGVVK